jgi:hypothetical protein
MQLIREDPPIARSRPHIALAIRKHARLTGDYPRAIKALEQWAAVHWGRTVSRCLGGQLDMGVGVAALADMLMASGQKRQGAGAARMKCWRTATVQIERYGRGEVWVNEGRAIAIALLGGRMSRRDAATPGKSSAS